MLRSTKKQRQQRTPAQILSTIGSTIVAAPLAWIAYSATLINHNIPLPPAIQAPRRTFTSGTVGELSYYADTHAGGKPLVLIHSINAGSSAYEMRPLFDHYRNERSVYALDLPGFGFSERADREYTPDLYAAAIRESLQNEVQSDNGVDLVALSLSCEFAARVAYEQPHIISTLALISPTGFSYEGQQNRIERAQRTGTSDRLHNAFTFPLWSQAFYDALASRPSLRYYLQRQFVGHIDEGLVDYAYLTTHQPGAKHAPLYFISGKLFAGTIRQDVYDKLEQPTLVIYDRDPNVTFDRLPATIKRPNWQEARITPTLGLPHFERLAQTTEALDRFWQGR